MLLNIQEPGSNKMNAVKDIPAIGIDLGTTNSVVAISENGVCRDLGGIIPSVVSYKDGSVIVGQGALQHIDKHQSVKRSMGQEGGELPIKVSAEILRFMRDKAESDLGEAITKAVITVPAYFDDAARQATKDAAKVAGLEVLRLINEPTAAAVAYGLDNEAEGTYVIYDFGGGTFDVSVLKMEKGVFRVLATGGDVGLGGDDFDSIISKHLFQDTSSNMLALAREIKEHLSHSDEWNNDKYSLTKDVFEDMVSGLVDRTISLCSSVLQDSGVKKNEISGVVMVGGSTRVPLVRKKVAECFATIPFVEIDPDRVVAFGAAIQAEALSNGSSSTLLLDVCPLSLGLETYGGLVEKIIERNTTIPVAKSQEFTTYQDGQVSMKVHVLQGEREMVDQCRSLAEFTLTDIPPMKAGFAKIKITFTLDADGLLSVEAIEETTQSKQKIEVKPSYGLPEDKVEEMLLDSFAHAKEDIMLRILEESRLEAQQMLKNIKEAIEQDGDLLSSEEDKYINSAIKSLEGAISGTNRDLIDIKAQELDKNCSDFAEKRVDRALSIALAGKDVEGLEKEINSNN